MPIQKGLGKIQSIVLEFLKSGVLLQDIPTASGLTKKQVQATIGSLAMRGLLVVEAVEEEREEVKEEAKTLKDTLQEIRVQVEKVIPERNVALFEEEFDKLPTELPIIEDGYNEVETNRFFEEDIHACVKSSFLQAFGIEIQTGWIGVSKSASMPQRIRSMALILDGAIRNTMREATYKGQEQFKVVYADELAADEAAHIAEMEWIKKEAERIREEEKLVREAANKAREEERKAREEELHKARMEQARATIDAARAQANAWKVNTPTKESQILAFAAGVGVEPIYEGGMLHIKKTLKKVTWAAHPDRGGNTAKMQYVNTELKGK